MAAATYETTVTWRGAHLGYLRCGNGPEMEFSAPPELQGQRGVLTPEDAFVAAVNTCVMMMFIWAAERFKLDLLAYECRAEGEKKIELDRTEIFTKVTLRPRIKARNTDERRVRRALDSAAKYSLVANSIESELIVEPQITIA
jgi:organic hydroperoxide reductase OsmC/OhrA